MQCPGCGAILPDAARFCVGCGVAAPPACRGCGQALSADANFCPRAVRKPPIDSHPRTLRRSLRRKRSPVTLPTPASSGVSSPCCSAISWARPHCRRAWIRRTCGKSSVPIIDASPKPWRRSTASSPATWATGQWSISAIRVRTKTTRSALYGQRWRSAAT